MKIIVHKIYSLIIVEAPETIPKVILQQHAKVRNMIQKKMLIWKSNQKGYRKQIKKWKISKLYPQRGTNRLKSRKIRQKSAMIA